MCLTADVHPFRCGDRLEADGKVLDVCGDLTTLEYPLRITFWRQTGQSFINWPCPLFTQGGIPIRRVLADVQHTLDAGASTYVSGPTFALLLEKGIYGSTDRRKENRERKDLKHMQTRLDAWYATRGCRVAEIASIDITVFNYRIN